VKVVCGWCPQPHVIKPGDGTLVSHGICEKAARKLVQERETVMKVSVSEREARALLSQLPDTPECRTLKARLNDGLNQNKTLTADELGTVVVTCEAFHDGSVKAMLLVDETDDVATQKRKQTEFVTNLATAMPKLRAMHQQQLARERWEGTRS
jgi:hypothetical protein